MRLCHTESGVVVGVGPDATPSPSPARRGEPESPSPAVAEEGLGRGQPAPTPQADVLSSTLSSSIRACELSATLAGECNRAWRAAAAAAKPADAGSPLAGSQSVQADFAGRRPSRRDFNRQPASADNSQALGAERHACGYKSVRRAAYISHWRRSSPAPGTRSARARASSSSATMDLPGCAARYSSQASTLAKCDRGV
jgi:hypothetical protein